MKIKNLYIYGDSLVSCKNIPFNYKWTHLLKEKINKNISVIIKNIDGVTTTEAINKMNFKVKKKSLVLVLLGVNDSIYYKSMKRKPLVEIGLFKKNYVKILKIILKINKTKVFLINGHKFYRKRLEGNSKTHNNNYLIYIKALEHISNKMNVKIINTYNYLNKFSAKKNTLPLPDGLHLSKFGSKKYFEKIFADIKGFL